ncbi:concanavalin A-like lectin/glucanase domain-containing protein [Mariannaea sp. PMI_226]|nr:concanavalin A-like lectin/glucanase domain-containing protein [Mariannaea sp. PMI_226]
MRLDLTLSALLAASVAQAQYLISELSFGHAGRISAPNNGGKIPGFVLQGSPGVPEVLSNRIILTPLAPGNQRGAIWAQQQLQRNQWIADFDFRASGPERGGGNLNIWLVRDGSKIVSSSSVYTVGKFDGLVLTIDKTGGSSGIIRGYLNDGTTDFSSKQRVEELAFGHCPYSYRNLGRPSQVKVKQTSSSFRVEIDGQLCFESNKISIPQGYIFGITAATPEIPDSFELFKMVVMSENSDSSGQSSDDKKTQQKQSSSKKANNYAKKDASDDGDLADEDPDTFATSKQQFVDLHNRLQNTNHQLSGLHRTVSRHQQQDEKRHEEISLLLSQLRTDLRKMDDINELQSRVGDLKREVADLRRELLRQLQTSERSVRGLLDTHHSSVTEAVLSRLPGHKFLIFFFLSTQVLLMVAFVAYKRRRASMPKKYL